MRIEKGTAAGAGEYWLLRVEKNEFVCDGGKPLPYATTLGTLEKKRGGGFKIKVWMPAAYTPRGYKSAAKRELERAAAKLAIEGA